MRYEVTTVDMCVQGFERLRRQDEFILNAYPAKGETGAGIVDELLSDIQSCSRPDGFDYDAARAAINDYFDLPTRDGLTAEVEALDLPDEDGDDEGNPVVLFVYVIDREAE